MSDTIPMVSIIVPVYNVEKYLARAVKSLCDQTYQNIEIILVDDGSTDQSGRICDDEEKKDPRLRVLHQENLGVSAARNNGIVASRGKYIYFVDADDTLTDTAIENMLKIMEEKNCDMVICGVERQLVDAYGRIYFSEILCLEREGFYSNVDLLLRLRSGSFLETVNCTSAWNRLYRRADLICEKEPFPEDMRYCEDVFFSIGILDRCSKIYYLKQPFYHYYQYNVKARKSLMNSRVEGRFEIYKKIHLELSRTLVGRIGRAEFELCQHNYIDRVILACVKLCSLSSSYDEDEIVKKLHGIVNDDSVIDAMCFYNRKAEKNWTNSWTIPLLIRLKKVEYLLRFARKVAKVKCC